MFSELIIGYLFLGGAGAGFLVLLCILEYANSSRDYLTRLAFPHDFFERAWLLCGGVLVLAVLLLVADLGITDRAFYVLAYPTASPLTVGAYALACSLLVAGVFCVLAYTSESYAAIIPAQRIKGAPRSQGWPIGLSYAMRALELFGILAGCIVMVYTGLLLSSLPSVLAWATPLVPVLFVLSSLSCGIALVFFTAAFTESRHTFLQTLRRFANFDTALIAVEIVALAAYIVWCLYGVATRDAAHALLTGSLAPWLWGVLIVAGLCAPVVLERLLTRQNYRTQLMWVAGGILAGGFALRYCIVGLAAFDPSVMYNVASLAL